MALANFAAYKTAINQRGWYPWTKSVVMGVTGRAGSSWLGTPDAGAAPTTAAALDSTNSAGLLRQPALTTTTNALYLAQAEIMLPTGAGNGAFLLMDRLSHQGGLDGTSTAAQTTNLPTAALTRYTSGVGVMAGLEIYTAVGATATTATISYTNQAGTAGRTSKAIAFGGSSDNNASRFFTFPLQDGDTGVKAVASVTLAASTATVGAFGVVLFKPLAIFANVAPAIQGMQANHYDGVVCGGMKLCEIDDQACLFMAGWQSQSATTIVSGAFNIIEVA